MNLVTIINLINEECDGFNEVRSRFDELIQLLVFRGWTKPSEL